jgi:hypothetical protein
MHWHNADLFTLGGLFSKDNMASTLPNMLEAQAFQDADGLLSCGSA